VYISILSDTIKNIAITSLGLTKMRDANKYKDEILFSKKKV